MVELMEAAGSFALENITELAYRAYERVNILKKIEKFEFIVIPKKEQENVVNI